MYQSSGSNILNPSWPPLDAETDRLQSTTALAVGRLARLVSGGTICSKATETNWLIYVLRHCSIPVAVSSLWNLTIWRRQCWNVWIGVYRQWLLLFAHSIEPKGPVFNDCSIQCKCGVNTCLRKPLGPIGEDQIELISLFWSVTPCSLVELWLRLKKNRWRRISRWKQQIFPKQW